MVGRRALFSAVPVIGLVACANIWGFSDLGIGQGGPADATASAVQPDVAVASDASAFEASEDDSEASSDDSPVTEGADSALDAAEPDAAEASTPPDAGGGGKTDASDAAPPVTCASICTGCCDIHGDCQAGTATAVCGIAGAACADCTMHSCSGLLSTGCCASHQACGCTVALICN